MRGVKRISPWQFAAFRVLFGSYLTIHFAALIPYGDELFSREGLLPEARLNFTYGILPNPLEHFDSPAFVAAFLILLTLLAVAFAAGVWRRTAAILLWYGWACLFNRNNLILNPGLPYVGLLLLLCALAPAGEPLRPGGRSAGGRWEFPAGIYWTAWLLLAAGYTYSGVVKLDSPSWIDGTAMHHLLTNPLARPGVFREMSLAMPPVWLKGLTWFALVGEILFLPLSLWRRGRLVAWVWMLAMHLGILLVVDFADLTYGMVMIHLFTFDPDWVPAKRISAAPLILFDGECALCDRSVQTLLDEDKAGIFRYAPLQGPTAGAVLARHGLTGVALQSLVLVEGHGADAERIHRKSEGVLRALAMLGGFWRVVSWLRLVPRPIRDAGYDFVARHRYRWFGRVETCRRPEPLWQDRFLP